MALELVQMSASRTFTAADREAAYHAWRAGGRSLRKLSELTGVSKSTLGNWCLADGWMDRARREDTEEAVEVRRSFAGVLAATVFDNLATAIEIRDDRTAPPRDRLAAAQYLNGLNGLAPLTRTAVAFTADTEPEHVAIGEGLTIDQLMAIEASARTKP